MKTLPGSKRMMLVNSIIILIVICEVILIQGCSNDYSLTGVNSPDPGILQIYLKSDDSDNYLVFAGDTVTVGSGDDFLILSVGQGRAYRDSNFAVLYKSIDEDSIDSYRERTKYFNIIEQEEDQFREFLIFETFLPQATFDSLKISISAYFLYLGYYAIPIEMPEEVSPLIKFDQNFNINEGRVTEIHLQIKPFKSLVRVMDSYHFYQEIEVLEIKYL